MNLFLASVYTVLTMHPEKHKEDMQQDTGKLSPHPVQALTYLLWESNASRWVVCNQDF